MFALPAASRCSRGVSTRPPTTARARRSRGRNPPQGAPKSPHPSRGSPPPPPRRRARRFRASPPWPSAGGARARARLGTPRTRDAAELHDAHLGPGALPATDRASVAGAIALPRVHEHGAELGRGAEGAGGTRRWRGFPEAARAARRRRRRSWRFAFGGAFGGALRAPKHSTAPSVAPLAIMRLRSSARAARARASAANARAARAASVAASCCAAHQGVGRASRVSFAAVAIARRVDSRLPRKNPNPRKHPKHPKHPTNPRTVRTLRSSSSSLGFFALALGPPRRCPPPPRRRGRSRSRTWASPLSEGDRARAVRLRGVDRRQVPPLELVRAPRTGVERLGWRESLLCAMAPPTAR